MPDARRTGGATSGTGAYVRRVLPRHARERLFDPAAADLLADRARRGTGPPSQARVMLLALDCLRVSFPRAFVRNRRPTSLAWGLFALLLVLTAIMTVRGALEAEYVKALDPYR